MSPRSLSGSRRARGRGRRRRRSTPAVTPLEDRRMLSLPTITTLLASSRSLTYGQGEVLTATVTTDPPGGPTPTGGTVSFLDGSNLLGATPLSNGTAAWSTTSLGA